MGGRGTYAAGNNVAYTYKTVSKIAGVKVLVGLGKKHDLPMENHSSRMYIRLKPDGTFHELRVYGEDKRVELEIAYHKEYGLSGNNKPILHYHTYQYGPKFKDGMYRSPALKITDKLIAQYKQYFMGVTL